MKSPINSSRLKTHLKNLIGWKTERKIVVIESDDWGSIRMPSSNAYLRLSNAGLNLNGGDGYRFSRYDSIESSSDLELLYEILNSVKDQNNSPATMTAMVVAANPDFEKIRKNGFVNYYYETVNKTFARNSWSEHSLELWNEGRNNKVFTPQFHGREHLNIAIWMNALRAKDRETHLAFNEGMWAFIPRFYEGTDLAYESAFQLSEYTNIGTLAEVIKDGLEIFRRLIDLSPTYFVPPNGKINNKLNSVCYENGIRYRSASSFQAESIGTSAERKVFHWLGQKDSSGIMYLLRNCIFEPSKQGKDWVDSTLYDIKTAFRYQKPAIISTHRVNYIGVHDTSNRDSGLRELKKLLDSIKKTWPDVCFMSSNQLGNLMDARL